MATGPQQKRKELREKRLQAEAKAKTTEKRSDLFKILGIAAFIGVVGVVIAVIALSGGDDNGGGNGSGSAAASIEGLRQSGNTLGQANAPVTLVEFGDLQCPICKQYAEVVLPAVIDGPVRNGTANMEFENWAILGPDSALAARAAIAAGEQDLMWSFIETFYDEQGVEGSGYITDEFLTDIAEQAGIPDIDKWNADRESEAADNELARIDELASENGFTGTPSFAFREADGSLTPLEDSQSSQAIIDAINEQAQGAGGGNQSGNGQ